MKLNNRADKFLSNLSTNTTNPIKIEDDPTEVIVRRETTTTITTTTIPVRNKVTKVKTIATTISMESEEDDSSVTIDAITTTSMFYAL